MIFKFFHDKTPQSLLWLLWVAVLSACSTAPIQYEPPNMKPSLSASRAGRAGAAGHFVRGNSQWLPASWQDLPGFDDDALFEAWNAWLKSCERPGAAFEALCPEVRRLSIGSEADRRQWLVSRLQPYRVAPLHPNGMAALLWLFQIPEVARVL